MLTVIEPALARNIVMSKTQFLRLHPALPPRRICIVLMIWRGEEIITPHTEEINKCV